MGAKRETFGAGFTLTGSPKFLRGPAAHDPRGFHTAPAADRFASVMTPLPPGPGRRGATSPPGPTHLDGMAALITTLYVLFAVTGALFAAVELRLLARFWRNQAAIRELAGAGRRGPQRSPRADPGADAVPTVTIQVPLYNERTAAARAIEAAAHQDYPAERLDIQVLDDSTDETTAIVAELVERLRSEGVRIEHVRRDHRRGYKAGALAEGLDRSESELVALFDADFTPDPGFLRRLVLEDRIFDEPEVAFVQARWGFEESTSSLLTLAQSVLLDRHFYIEKPTREFSGRVTTFNGSGGIWRRAAIDAAGGWMDDTLTEDLDLSYRCALLGWRGRYVRDVSVPSELPSHMRSFKVQQRRWSRGSAQTLKKLTRRVLVSKNVLRDRWDEAFLLAGYAIHPLLLGHLLLWPWAVLYMNRLVFLTLQVLASLAFVAIGIGLFLTLRERGERLSPRAALAALAGIMVGIGLMVNNTVGQIRGFLQAGGEFARTPKLSRRPAAPAPAHTASASSTFGAGGGGSNPGHAPQTAVAGAERPYGLPLDWTFFLEVAVIGYCLWGATLLVTQGEALWAVPLVLWSFCLGLVVQLQMLPQPS